MTLELNQPTATNQIQNQPKEGIKMTTIQPTNQTVNGIQMPSSNELQERGAIAKTYFPWVGTTFGIDLTNPKDVARLIALPLGTWNGDSFTGDKLEELMERSGDIVDYLIELSKRNQAQETPSEALIVLIDEVSDLYCETDRTWKEFISRRKNKAEHLKIIEAFKNYEETNRLFFRALTLTLVADDNNRDQLKESPYRKNARTLLKNEEIRKELDKMVNAKNFKQAKNLTKLTPLGEFPWFLGHNQLITLDHNEWVREDLKAIHNRSQIEERVNYVGSFFPWVKGFILHGSCNCRHDGDRCTCKMDNPLGALTSIPLQLVEHDIFIQGIEESGKFFSYLESEGIDTTTRHDAKTVKQLIKEQSPRALPYLHHWIKIMQEEMIESQYLEASTSDKEDIFNYLEKKLDQYRYQFFFILLKSFKLKGEEVSRGDLAKGCFEGIYDEYFHRLAMNDNLYSNKQGRIFYINNHWAKEFPQLKK